MRIAADYPFYVLAMAALAAWQYRPRRRRSPPH